MAYLYEPSEAAGWLAVATSGRVLVAEARGDDARVSTLAGTLDADISVQHVLEVLTAQGLSATRPFALVFWVEGEMADKGLGVIVRGPAVVTVDTPGGSVVVASRGMTTWSEQVVEDATGFDIETPSDARVHGPSLYLGEGAAWARRISYRQPAHRALAHDDASSVGLTSGSPADAEVPKTHRSTSVSTPLKVTEEYTYLFDAPEPTPTPTYALVFPDGSHQPLTAPVVLGRAPSASNVRAERPHLVTVTGDDISRSHVSVAVEDGTIVVTDLRSSNGTQVILPGEEPRQLRGGVPTPVAVGAQIDLGSDVVVKVTHG